MDDPNRRLGVPDKNTVTDAAGGAQPLISTDTPQASPTHLIIIPTYNTGIKVVETVREARRFWSPIWVVVDGSTDSTAEMLQQIAENDCAIRVFRLERNAGKGAAVLHALRTAAAAGYSHALVMDADGQHPANRIADFMAMSQQHSDAQILGVPVFDANAPVARVHGRKLSNLFANLETLWQGIGDSLYGFRVYPIAPLLTIMEQGRWMRGYDFDPEATVRLCWHGVRPINLTAPVKYFCPEDGGISHFSYVRDNLLLTWMHIRLTAGFLLRLPLLVWRKVRG